MKAHLWAGALLLIGCGGNVVVDTVTTGGTGAQGTGAATTTTSTLTSTSCVKCSAIFQGASSSTLCPGSSLILFENAQACVCNQVSCANLACISLCGGTMGKTLSMECQSCVASQGSACAMNVEACQADM